MTIYTINIILTTVKAIDRIFFLLVIIAIILALITKNNEYWYISSFCAIICFICEITIKVFKYIRKIKRKKNREENKDFTF